LPTHTGLDVNDCRLRRVRQVEGLDAGPIKTPAVESSPSAYHSVKLEDPSFTAPSTPTSSRAMMADTR
jgi:hypothetical protein